jgi:protoporphyrinogen/coproporphyrinogen III oxidase
MRPWAGRAPRVAVVGGGMAGLVAAYRLTRSGRTASGGPGFEVRLFERSGSAGGVVRTANLDGMLVEEGPDSFVVRKPWAVDLCRELGLGDDLIHPGTTGALVWARGELVPYPAGSAFGIPPDAESVLRWRGMSMWGRLRAVTDLWRPARRRRGVADDESLQSLLTRRLGAECANVLVGPLLAGVNSGDPSRLSVRATFPELAEWERTFGSLIRGSKAARRAAAGVGGQAPPMFATLRGGLRRLPEALVRAIGPGSAVFDSEVTRVDASPAGGFVIHFDGSQIEADAVIVAAPAPIASTVLTGSNPGAATELARIAYGSAAVVSMAYGPGSGALLPDATGFIVPAGATVAGGRPASITACTWVSRKWPNRAFGDRAVLRAFAGRAGDEAVLDLPDDQLVATLVKDIEAISPLGDVPEVWSVARWPSSMPQYELGHVDRVSRIEDALGTTPGLFVTGSAYGGVGLADVIRHAGETAERVRTHLFQVHGEVPAATS